MHRSLPWRVLALLVLLTLTARDASAQLLHKVAAGARKTERALLGKTNPHAPREHDVERLAKEIDWLEHLIESYGTVVPKHPDVWGEARLTKHRHQYEKEIEKRFNSDDFKETLQASVRQSDQAALSLAFALNAASGGAAVPTSNAAVSLSGDVTDAKGNPVITRTPPISEVDLSHFAAGSLSLEPTIVIDQLSRYLQNINDLRRVNEGDDTADSPGYALNLLRLPVSVLPGHNTRKGFGAEITFTMKPYISNELLPTTMRDLIINDVVDVMAVPLAGLFNNNPADARDFLTAFWQFKGQVQQWIEIYDRWLHAFTTTVQSGTLGDPHSWQADIDYLYNLRPYLQFRFLQIAKQAAEQQQLLVPCMDCVLDANGTPPNTLNRSLPICPIWQFPFPLDPEAKAALIEQAVLVAKLDKAGLAAALKMMGVRISGKESDSDLANILSRIDFLIVRVSAMQAQTALNQLAAATCDGKFTATITVNLVVPADMRADGAHEIQPCVNVPGLDVPFSLSLASDSNNLSGYRPGDFVDRHQQPCFIENMPKSEKCAPPKSAPVSQAHTSSPSALKKHVFAKPGSATPAHEGEHRKRARIIDGNDASIVVRVSAEEPELAPSPENLLTPFDNLDATFEKFKATAADAATTIITQKLADSLKVPLAKALNHPYHNGISLNLDQQIPSTIGDLFECGPIPTSAPVHSGSGKRPLVGSQVLMVYGFPSFLETAYAAYTNLRTNIANHKVVHVYDINQFITQECRSAYEFLEKRDQQALWSFCTPALAHAIDARDSKTVFQIREEFLRAAGGTARHSITASLAWAIIVDAALLNEQLAEDIRHTAQSKGCGCLSGDGLQFVGPKELITAQAQEVFKQYVLCRWPIIVFALDPVAEQQNVADVFSRRRDLQLAVAVAVASGNVSPSAAGRFTRRLELDMETIALNQTAVGFSHGNDTFGWRFYPRVQSPDTPGTIGAFCQTLVGGPNRDSDLRTRQLEGGMRDCSAVVIMPSFVPYVTITSRANWFGVTNPRKKELTLHDTMRISRTYQSLQNAVACTGDSPLYRQGDVSQMGEVLEQLERRMPLQSMQVEVPYLNTLGGFELFDTGVDGLGPQLEGWYGAPGIDPDGVTTLYLIGKKFNVHETRIIAGGRSVPFRMLSRKVLEVTIPPGTQPLLAQEYHNFVDVQAAAPYGTSSHMLIPRVTTAAPTQRFVWASASSTIDISYKAGPPPAPLAVSLGALPEFQMSAPIAAAPVTLTLNLTINEYTSGREFVLGTSTATARFDAQRQRYIVDGVNFSSLANDLMKAATTRFGVVAPSADQTARWLIRGTIAPAGSLNEPIQGSMVLDVKFRLVQ